MKLYEALYKPRPVFFKEDDPNFPKELFMGFEYEFYRRSDAFGDNIHPKEFDKVNEIFDNKNLFYLKWDGSCDVELVSNPFNWPFYVKNLSKFEKAYKHVRAKATTSTTDTGFHVHFSKKYFTPIHLKRMYKALVDNERFFCKLSGRQNYSIDEYAAIDVLRFRKTGDKIPTRSFKYSAIRVTNNTLEFRLFKGTHLTPMIHAYLEFWVAFILYTKTNDIFSIDKFTEYVCKDYKLACHLINQRWSNKQKKIG